MKKLLMSSKKDSSKKKKKKEWRSLTVKKKAKNMLKILERVELCLSKNKGKEMSMNCLRRLSKSIDI